MDQATLNALSAKGMGIAAQRLGAAFTLYRPGGAFLPVSGSGIGTVTAAYSSSLSVTLSKVILPDHPFVGLLADSRALQQSDYLVGSETLFVARIEPYRAALGVLCNATLSLLTAVPQTQAGTNAYGGMSTSASTSLATGWPASLLVKTKTEADPTKLPSDTRSAYYSVLLPNIPGVTIAPGMQLQDANSIIYQVISSEKSITGWLVEVALETT